MKSPQLHEMGMNQAGKELEGILLLHAQIISLVKFMGADWDRDMAKEAAQLAYQEANWMTVAEVKYFITRIKCGKYTSNQNFKPGIFMEYLNEYINEILAVRGSVNSYAWRDNRAADENFQLTSNPVTGEPGKPADQNMIKTVLGRMAERFKNLEQIQREEDERARKARWQALKDQRDKQIVDYVEQDAAKGIAPDKYLMKQYFEAVERLAENNL